MRLVVTGPVGRIGHVLLSILAVLAISCRAPAPAPVYERAQPPTEKILYHIVAPDETLYSIAWRYELDFQQLAAVNGLQPPYPLHAGQKLSLDMSKRPTRPAMANAARKPAVTAYPIKDSAPAPKPSPPPKVVLPEPPSLPKSGWQWQWPVRGRVAREYDANSILKGISIYTGSGEKVVAAAPGVVVYAGEGLRGYGKLIIVKHSEEALSAYAHNSRILVKENQEVKQGQQIAEVGVDNTSRHRLYFEIRENGKPVDPLKRLPK